MVQVRLHSETTHSSGTEAPTHASVWTVNVRDVTLVQRTQFQRGPQSDMLATTRNITSVQHAIRNQICLHTTWCWCGCWCWHTIPELHTKRGVCHAFTGNRNRNLHGGSLYLSFCPFSPPTKQPHSLLLHGLHHFANSLAFSLGIVAPSINLQRVAS